MCSPVWLRGCCRSLKAMENQSRARVVVTEMSNWCLRMSCSRHLEAGSRCPWGMRLHANNSKLRGFNQSCNRVSSRHEHENWHGLWDRRRGSLSAACSGAEAAVWKLAAGVFRTCTCMQPVLLKQDYLGNQTPNQQSDILQRCET